MAGASVAELTAKIVIDDSDLSKLDAAGQKIDSLASKGESSGRSLQAVGVGLTAVGAAGVAGFGAALNTAADFEAALSNIGAVGGTAAQQSMADIEAAALRMGAETAFSASQAAAGMEELIKAGVPVPDVLDGAAQSALDLAAATGISVPEAAAQMAVALNVFGETLPFDTMAEKAENVADVIARVSAASATGASEIGAAFGNAAPVAKMFGISMEELAMGIGVMSNSGIAGAEAGTMLKSMLLALNTPTKAQTAAMTSLGLSYDDFFDSAGNLVGIEDMFAIISDSVNGTTLSARDLDEALATIFGSYGITGASVFFDTQTEGWDKMRSGMDEAGSAQQQAEMRLDNLRGALDAMGGSIETAAIVIGTALIPAIRSGAEGITALVNAFLGLPEPVQQSVAIIGALASVLALGAGGLLLIVPKVLEFSNALKTLGVTTQSVAAIFAKLPLSLGPIGIILAAIALAVVAYQTNFLGFADAVNALASAFRDKLQGAAQIAQKFMAELGREAAEVGKNFGLMVKDAQDWASDFASVNQEMADNSDKMTEAGRAVDGFGEAVKRMTGLDVTGVFDALGNAVDWVIGKLQGLQTVSLQGFLDGVAAAAQQASDYLFDLFNMLGDMVIPQGLKDLAQWFGDTIGSKVLAFVGKLGELKDRLASIILPPQLEAVGDWFGTTFVSRVQSGINKLGEFTDALGEATEAALANNEVVAAIDAYDPADRTRQYEAEQAEIHGNVAAVRTLNTAYQEMRAEREFGTKTIAASTQAMAEEAAAVEEVSQAALDLAAAYNGILNPAVEQFGGTLQRLIPFGNDVLDVLDAMSEAGAIQGGGMTGFLDGLNDAQQGLNDVLGSMNAIASLGAGLESAVGVAQKLVGDPGVYATVDDLLAKSLITFEEYNAAQADEVRIVEANTRAQDALNVMRVGQVDALANQAQASANYLVALSKLPAAEQAHALAMMDSANQAKVATALSTAYSASLGEIPTEAATDIIANSAGADPVLAGILEKYGLIEVGANGEITVNFPDTSQQALDRFTAAFSGAEVQMVEGLIEVTQSNGTTLVYDQFNNLVAQSGTAITASVDVKLNSLDTALASGAGFGAGMGGGIGQDIANQVQTSAEQADYSGVTTAVQSSVSTALSSATVAPGDATALSTSALDAVASGLTENAQTVSTAMETVVGDAITAGTTKAGDASPIGEELVAQATAGVSADGGDFGTQAQTMVNDAVTNATQTADGANEIGITFVDQATVGIVSDGGEFSTQGQTMVSDAITNATTTAADATGIGSEFVTQATSGVTADAATMADAARQMVLDAIAAAQEAGAGAYDAGLAIGQNIGSGLVAGINSMQGAVQSAAANIASTAVTQANVTLGARSPSRVFMEIGGYVAEGFANGIRSGEGTVAEAVIALVESITGTVRDRLSSVSDLFADTGYESGRKLKEGLDATTADPSDYTVGSDEWHQALREKIDASMGDIGRSGGKKLKDGITDGVGSIEESLGALVDINSTLQPVLDAWTTIDIAIVDAGASSSETAQALGLMAENLRAVGMGNKEITYLADQFDLLATDIFNAGGTMESEMLDRVGRLGKELPIALDAAGLAFGRFGQMSSDEVLKSMAVMLDGITTILRDLVSAVREAFGLAASAGTDQFSENVWDGLVKGMDGGTEIIGSKGDEWQDALITVGERAGQTLGEAMAEGISQKEIDWLSSIGGIVDRGVKRATEDGKKGVTAGEMVVQEMTRGTRRKEAEYLRRMTEIVDAGVQQGVQDAAKGADVGAAFSTNVAEGMNDGLADVERAAQGMSDEAITALRSRARMMVEIGLDYSVGFAQGMLDGADHVREAASEVGRQAERELRRATESESPSKAAMRVGQDVGEGFAQGIESGEGRVKQAARKLWKAAMREVLAGSGPARFLGEDWAAEFWAGMLNSPDMTGPLAAWITDQMVAAATTALGRIQAEITGLAAQLDIARRTVGTTSIPEVAQPEPVDTAQRDLLQDQLDATRELTAALEKAFTSAFDAAHKAHVAFVKGQISESQYAAAYQTAVQAHAAKEQSKAQETALEQQIAALTAAIEAETAARQKAYDEQVAAREQAVAAELAAQQAAVTALEQQYLAAQQAMTQAVIDESTRRIAELQREAGKARDPQERAEIKAMIALEQERINVAMQLGRALDAAANAGSAFDLSVANAQVEFLTAQLAALGQVDVGSLLQAAADSISAAAEKMAGAADKIKKALGGGGKDAEGGGGGNGFDDIKRGADGAAAAIDRTSGAADRFEIAGGRMAAAGRLAGNEIGRGIGEGAGVAERAIDELVRNGTINLERGMLEAGRKGGKSMTDGAATAIADGQVHMIKRVETSWEAATINGEKVAGEGGRKMVSEMTRSIDGELVTRTREVSRGTEQMMQTASQDATKVAQKGGKDVGSDFANFAGQGIKQGTHDVTRAGKDIMDGAGAAARKDANRLGKDAGDDLGRGVAEGIRGRQNDINNAAREAIRAANQAARQQAQARSPSKLFRELGHDLVDGLTLGIYERRQEAAREMGRLLPSTIGNPTLGGGVTGARAGGGNTTHITIHKIEVADAEGFVELIERVQRGEALGLSRS